MRYGLVFVAWKTGRTLAEVLDMHPRDLATLMFFEEERDAAMKRARRK